MYFVPMRWFFFLASLFDAFKLKEAYLNANSSIALADNIILSPIAVWEFSSMECIKSLYASVISCEK